MCSLGPEWHISSTGNDFITENNSIKDKQKILNLALNTDLKEICDPVLVTELSKENLSKFVLQIQKIRNISAPKANEESQAAPRMLKLSLTDGDTFIQALEMTPINSISRSRTPPGSKVLINNAKIVSGYLLLTANNCCLLGGKVPHLVEKWEVAKSITRTQRRTSCEDGPPPWVNFGAKIKTGNQEDCLPSLGKNKDVKDNSEFELQRQGAIAEATSGVTRKVFGGRVKQNIQTSAGTAVQNKRDQGKGRNRNLPKEREIEEKPLKPSEKVSLFAFLEDKLPVSDSSKNGENSRSSFTTHARNDSQKYTTQRMNNGHSNLYPKPFYNQADTRSYPNSKSDYGNTSLQNKRNESSVMPSKNNAQFNKPYNPNSHSLLSGNNDTSYNQPKMENGNATQYSKKYFNQGDLEESYRNNRTESQGDRFYQNKRNENAHNYNDNRKKYNYDDLSSHNKTNSSDKTYLSSHNKTNSSDKTYQPNRVENGNLPQKSAKRNDNNYQKPGDQGSWYINPNTSQNYQHNQKHEKPQYDNYKKNNTYNPNSQPQLQQKHDNSLNAQTSITDFNKAYKEQQRPSVATSSNNSSSSSHIKNEIAEINHSMEKVSLNSQFASRSLRQHLNLGPGKKEDPTNETDLGDKERNVESWKVGDEILAKYWEDGKFYNATITAVTDKTYAVKFKGYGNIEEILKYDCLPLQNNTNKPTNNNRQNRQYGSMEFRRSNRNYN